MPKKLKNTSILPEKKAQPAAVPAKHAADLALSPDEEASMRERHKQFVLAKSAFAELAFQIASLEARKGELLSKVNETSAALVAEIRERAKARGVDPDAKAAEGQPRLSFDLDTFRFTKS